MKRSLGADQFADAVVRRNETDIILKPWLVLFALVLPFIVGLITASDLALSGTADGQSVAFPLLCGMMQISCTIGSLILLLILKGNRRHLARDAQWMQGLCDYVDEHGRDSGKMRRIASIVEGVITAPATALSTSVWAVELILLASSMAMLASIDSGKDLLIGLAILSLILLIFQFVLTSGCTLGFPARHDKLQSEFTKEFSDEAKCFGMRVEPMEHSVLNRRTAAHVILVIITAGLYLYVCLFVSCKNMNEHLSMQNTYETRLLKTVIEFEGGTGIEATKTSTRRIQGIV